MEIKSSKQVKMIINNNFISKSAIIPIGCQTIFKIWTDMFSYIFSKVWGISSLECAGCESLLFNFDGFTKYFLSSVGVGQYSMPLRFVIHKHFPATFSSFISSKAPKKKIVPSFFQFDWFVWLSGKRFSTSKSSRQINC